MAINPSTTYGGQIDTSDPTGYPNGKARNVTVNGDGTGTPLEEAWVNDFFGFVQAMLDRAGYTASGVSEKVGASQLLDALDKRFGTTGDLVVQGYEAYAGAPHPAVLDTTAQGVTTTPSAAFSDDGTKMIVLDTAGALLVYDLSTAWDTRTATYNGATGTTVPNDTTRVCWKPDGTSFYCLRDPSGTPDITQYDCSTAWNPSTKGVATTHSLGATLSDVVDFCFADNGERMYLLGLNTGAMTVRRWTVTPAQAWNIEQYSDAADEIVNVTSNRGTSLDGGLEISSDGRRLFVSDDNEIFEYRFDGSPFINSAVWDGRRRDISGLLATSDFQGLHFSPGGGHLVIADDVGDRIISIYSSVVRLAD